MPLLNYTTSIDPHKTVGEIQKLLASKGASGVLLQYNTHGDPSAVAFQIEYRGNQLRYRLPCRAERVCDVLGRQWQAGKIERRYTTMQHATRVAWRIIKDWVEAQLAIVESGMVEIAEVFLPYQLVADDKTVFDVMRRNLLTGPTTTTEGDDE
jgi:hypothetical protein